MPRVIHIHASAPPKPAMGQPCNGCGVCCLDQPCPMGMLVSRRRTGACSAVVWDASQTRYLCGLLAQPQAYIRPRWLAGWIKRLAARSIAAGKGCDCDLEWH